MSDLDKFIALYASLGIPLKAETVEGERIIKTGANGVAEDGRAESTQVIKLEADDHAKIGGYQGFYTEIKFTKTGAFINQGFWE